MTRLFGHEDHLDELRRRARELGVAGQVDFLGHVEDVDALSAGWDVAVQASTRPEPLGQNVLQYLAAGRAVVAADEGGPAEWITDGVNGLLVPPRDVAALASALGRLDADAALRARLGDRGRRDARPARRHGRHACARGVLRVGGALRSRGEGRDHQGLSRALSPARPAAAAPPRAGGRS